MVYIEKNDKPNFLEKILNIIKINRNTLYLPISVNNVNISNGNIHKMTDTKIKENNKKTERLAQKVNKLIPKLSTSKKVVLSKEIKKENVFVNYLNSYGYEIADGKWLSEILLTDIIESIVKQNNIEKANISILINDITEIEYQNIKILAEKYLNINIVTNHIEKFKKLEEQLLEEGITVIVTNNKRKSLIKSEIIINIDFPNEIFNKYRLNEYAIVVSFKMPLKINQKRFNGKLIKDYEISYREEICDEKYFCENYYLKDLYESQIYKHNTFKDLRDKIEKDMVKVKSLT